MARRGRYCAGSIVRSTSRLGRRQHSFFVGLFFLSSTSLALSPHSTVAIVGGGISGLVVGHVLQQSGRYNVTLLERQETVGGHIRSKPDPNSDGKDLLNIGHATHMGMFVNLRLMLRHFDIQEVPVGRGPNHQPGLFRMLNICIPKNDINEEAVTIGQRVQPPLEHILSPRVWWDAVRFYYDSYRSPHICLASYLDHTHNKFSSEFLDIVYWSLATFEFDKDPQSVGDYALGTVRVLVITQAFFQYLLLDAFQGRLPEKIDRGLKTDLAQRVIKGARILHDDNDNHDNMKVDHPTTNELLNCFHEITENSPLASYFTSNYPALASQLAVGIGRVCTNTTVTSVCRKMITASFDEDQRGLDIVTSHGEVLQADYVVFATQPAIAAQCLQTSDQQPHGWSWNRVLQRVADNGGAVGVQLVPAQELPFVYPPPPNAPTIAYHVQDPPAMLGIFDISQLTRAANGGDIPTSQPTKPGWLSIAYSVYCPPKEQHDFATTHGPHLDFLNNNPSISTNSKADVTVYPWTRATATFVQDRAEIVQKQGHDHIFVIGQALTGVNKASELQVTNALKLCSQHFGVLPPWRYAFLYPLLPDCNDEDAFTKATSPWQAAQLAIKSLVGSFLLTGVVAQLGSEGFE